MTQPPGDFGGEARDHAHPPWRTPDQPPYSSSPGGHPWPESAPTVAGSQPPVNYPEDVPSYPPPSYPPPAPGYPPPSYPPPTPSYPPPASSYPPPSYPPPSYPPPSYSPGPPGYPGHPGYPDAYDPYQATPRPGTNPLAIGSLVCSIGGFPLLFACYTGLVAWIAGIVLGIVALNQVKQTNQDGRGLAIGGIVVGAVGLALSAIGMIFFFAILGSQPST